MYVIFLICEYFSLGFVKLSAWCTQTFMNHSWHSAAVHRLLEPKIKTYLFGRFPVAITESKNMSQDSEFVQIVKVAAHLREPKHVDISALDALFSFQKISFAELHWCSNMICLLHSDWASSPAVFLEIITQSLTLAVKFFLWTLGLLYSRDWKINEQINYADHETFKCSSAWLIV